MDQYYTFVDTDEKLAALNNNLQIIYDKYIPTKRVVKKSGKPPWLNNDISRAMEDRDIAHSIFRRNKTLQSQRIFCRLRNKVISMVRSAKQQFWQVKLPTNQSPKKLWRNINELGLAGDDSKSANTFCPDELNNVFAAGQNNNNNYAFSDNLQYFVRDRDLSYCYG